ncbi:hypothetical protein M0R72_16120 [Candidatus Pacearchaeota archaeon]|jgi:hypothetical protein|nr:hypothetical protein [Candidatus Pacearchaeota archaeon]
MNKLCSTLASGIFSAYLLFGGCDFNFTNISKKDDSVNKEYHLNNFKEITSYDNFEQPSGISTYKKANSRNLLFEESIGLEGKLLFYEAPTINYETGSFSKHPSIYSTSDISNLEKIFEFSDDYINEFEGNGRFMLNDGTLKIQGLLSSLVISSDNSIFFISNTSNKMFKIYKPGEIFTATEFLADDELYGVNSMTLGDDGKIYAVQEQLKSNGNSVRNRRVISIDLSNSLIKEEFVLPEGVSTDVFFRVKESYDLSVGNRLDITQNNEVGKLLNGFDFFISDQINGKIYAHSPEMSEAGYFASDLNLPSSVVVDLEGKVITVEGPVLSLQENNSIKSIQINEPPKIVQIDSEANNTDLYSFLDEASEYDTEWYKILDNGFIDPINLYFDSALVDDTSNWCFYYTNSFTGKVGLISADKIPVSE